jgi:hypothetical protein
MSAALGVAAAVCSGLANGSWNLPTKPDAPRSVYAGTVWAWENIWFVANVLIPIFNTALVLAVVGPSVLSEVFAEAEPRHLWAICVPSLAWGWGGVGFGQAIKRLGVALGTSIVMGIIVVIGTALPAILDADELTATQASGVALGVALGVAGFVAGGRAGLLRDRALEKEKQTHVDVEVVDHARSDDVVAKAGLGGGKDTSRDAKLRESPSDSGGSSSDSFWVSILWCLAGGVLSSMLQFAFVFGGAVVDLAKNKGVPDAAAAMPGVVAVFRVQRVRTPRVLGVLVACKRNLASVFRRLDGRCLQKGKRRKSRRGASEKKKETPGVSPFTPSSCAR